MTKSAYKDNIKWDQSLMMIIMLQCMDTVTTKRFMNTDVVIKVLFAIMISIQILQLVIDSFHPFANLKDVVFIHETYFTTEIFVKL